MELAPSREVYARAPEGRAWRGPSWLSFCARVKAPGLWGFAVWGHVAGDDATDLVDTIRLELEPRVPPHRSLIDARRLTAVEPQSFEVFARYVQDHHALLGARVQALAIVRPPGLEGAVVAGFFQVLPPPYPVTVVDTVDAGLVALGEDPAHHTELAAFLDGCDDGDHDAVIDRLRALCLRTPRLELDDAARALGVSVRTLQRRLQDQDTRFIDVVASARLAVARARIEDTDAPLTAIALDAGFASLQHLGQAIKKATGLSPSGLRRRRRPQG